MRLRSDAVARRRRRHASDPGGSPHGVRWADARGAHPSDQERSSAVGEGRPRVGRYLRRRDERCGRGRDLRVPRRAEDRGARAIIQLGARRGFARDEELAAAATATVVAERSGGISVPVVMLAVPVGVLLHVRVVSGVLGRGGGAVARGARDLAHRRGGRSPQQKRDQTETQRPHRPAMVARTAELTEAGFPARRIDRCVGGFPIGGGISSIPSPSCARRAAVRRAARRAGRDRARGAANDRRRRRAAAP